MSREACTYIDALGGCLEPRAVFSDGAVIDLVPPQPAAVQPTLATVD